MVNYLSASGTSVSFLFYESLNLFFSVFSYFSYEQMLSNDTISIIKESVSIRVYGIVEKHLLCVNNLE